MVQSFHVKQSLRIVLLLGQPGFPGSLAYGFQLAQALYEAGHKLLCIYSEQAQSGLDLPSTLDFPALPLKTSPEGFSNQSWNLRGLRSDLKKFQPNLIYLFSLGWPFPWFQLLRNFDVPLIAGLDTRSHFEVLKARQQKRIDHYIVPSQATREELVNHTPCLLENIHVVPPGTLKTEEKETLQMKLNQNNEHTPVIACLSIFKQQPEQDEIIQAIQKFEKVHSDFCCLIVGKTTNLESLQRWIYKEKQGKYFIVGQGLTSYAAILKASDFALIPGTSYDHMLFALEAMKRGVTPLMPGSQSNFELIDDETTGVLYAPRNSEDFNLKLRTLMTQPELKRSIGKAAWEKIEHEFSMETMILKLLKVFDQCALQKVSV